MNAPLYSLDVLRLAAATAETARLHDPQATVERRSATCGSRIVVDVVLDGSGRVVGYGHAIHACALGQAAATLVARNAIGRDAAMLAADAALLAAYLAGASEHLPDWPGIEVLERTRPYSARHASVRLSIEAAAQAAREAGR